MADETAVTVDLTALPELSQVAVAELNDPNVEQFLMTTKFNPETDSDRPVVGETITDNDGVEYVVQCVSWLPISHFLNNKPQPDLAGYDKLLLREHTSRPAVIWTAWCNRRAAPQPIGVATGCVPQSERLTILANGDLAIRFKRGERAKLSVLVNSLKAAQSTGEEIESAVITAYFDGYTQTTPEHVGALTAAPLITDGTSVWGFMDYQVKSFVDELLAGEVTTWTKG